MGLSARAGLWARLGAILALLVSCSAPAAGPAGPATRPGGRSQTTENAWEIRFSLSGGFAGLDREVRIDSTGKALAEDRRSGQQLPAGVTKDELDYIASLIQTVKAPARGSSSQCRDCLNYGFSIRRNGEQLTASLDDTTLPGSEFEPLAKVLASLLNRALSSSK